MPTASLIVSATDLSESGYFAAATVSVLAAEGQRHLGDVAHDLLESLVAGDEVGLGIDLDHDRLAQAGIDADQAFGSRAAGLLVGLGNALLAQPVDGCFHVAVGLGQRRLAIHHARAGQFAEFFDLCCGNAHIRLFVSKCTGAASVFDAAPHALRENRADISGGGRPASGLRIRLLASFRRLFGRLGRGLFEHRLDRSLDGCADIHAERALLAGDAVERRLGDQVAIERDGAGRVVIARDREIDLVRVAVRIDDGHDRNAEALGLEDGDRFLVGVDHEHQVGRRAHVLDAAERLVELLALAVEVQALLLGEALGFAGEQFVELAQARDRIGDRLPVGQHAAEPARIDVVLGRTLRRIGDDVGRLALGADEEHAAALGDGVRNLLQRLVQQRHRLRQVDDVDVVAGAVDVGRHFRVPAVGLVAEVNASFQKLAHAEIRQSHSKFLSG